MHKLNPEKLSVEFRKGTTATEPIIPRRYTLTHSDITAELFLTIGLTYAYDKTNAMKDEVLGEWINQNESYLYNVYLDIDGNSGSIAAGIRNQIFRRELSLALEAIRYGDREFFSVHPKLDYSPIIVYFISADSKYNKTEDWGTFSDYNINNPSRYYRKLSFGEKTILIDMKIADVTGDGIPDKVSMYGNKPEEASEIFIDNISIVIEDGHTHMAKIITPKFNSGYNPRLFLGDFTKDKIDDIQLSIDSGGSGGYGYFYVYSFKNNVVNELFNFDKYNNEYKYKVDYADFFKVYIGNITLDKLFTIDISHKGYDYLSKYYDENGKLIEPVQGEVLALSTLTPIVSNQKNLTYDLLALQRIIGTSNSDTIGFIQNLLSWDNEKFVSSRMFTAIPGTNLISLY